MDVEYHYNHFYLTMMMKKIHIDDEYNGEMKEVFVLDYL
jgi:hypothetical protein